VPDVVAVTHIFEEHVGILEAMSVKSQWTNSEL
jgi:hypothetical protein